MRNILEYAKAIAALVGSIVTSLLAILPAAEYRWLAILGVIATAVATYRIPNALPGEKPEDGTPGKHEAATTTIG